MMMNTKLDRPLGGMMPVGRGVGHVEHRAVTHGAKVKARRHERRKVREVLHQLLLDDGEFW